jgi:hypothetical protein
MKARIAAEESYAKSLVKIAAMELEVQDCPGSLQDCWDQFKVLLLDYK